MESYSNVLKRQQRVLSKWKFKLKVAKGLPERVSEPKLTLDENEYIILLGENYFVALIEVSISSYAQL